MMLLALLFILLLGLVAYLWRRERLYLKKKTSEAMSERVWKDVVAEREEALQRRRKFKEALNRAGHKKEEERGP